MQDVKGFVDHLASHTDDHRAEYRELLAELVQGGLGLGRTEQLNVAVLNLGITPEQVQADADILKKAIALQTRIDNDTAPAIEAESAAREVWRAWTCREGERARLQADIDAKDAALERALHTARGKVDTLKSAASDLAAIKAQHPHLFAAFEHG